MTHQLPRLSYELDALTPAITRQTLEFHYGKHHQAYVNNLNGLLPGTKFENADLDTIVRESEGGIFNNGAQVWNHTFYFESFSPKPKGEPSGGLADKIAKEFGSLGELKEKFSKAATTLFGSGWAWLAVNANGQLEIIQESNAGNPLRRGMRPLITCDVWEHAYYLDYQNRRPDYVQAFWSILDWKVIEDRFARAV
jgi:Fe-Mn family superoxide dismutase